MDYIKPHGADLCKQEKEMSMENDREYRLELLRILIEDFSFPEREASRFVKCQKDVIGIIESCVLCKFKRQELEREEYEL